MDNEELTLFRDMARRALEQEISPHIEEWEAQHMVPRELWNTLGQAGLLCPDMPEEHGAAGTTPQVTFAIIEELSRMGFGGIASGYGIHSNIVAPYIEHFGTEEQKNHWLPKMEELPDTASEDAALAARLSNLTPQQLRVLTMVSEGKLNKQIAYDLDISEATVKSHVSAILQKLGVNSRTQAVIVANRLAVDDPTREVPEVEA